MTGHGYRVFVDELERFAARSDDPRSAAIAGGIAGRIAAPLRVAVQGRRGTGRRTVERALATAGLYVAGQDTAGPQDTSGVVAGEADVVDVIVYVIAEVLKPEDSEAIAAAGPPVLSVLNKADLAGFAAGGPIVAARSACARFSELSGVGTEPMVALLAVAALDDGLLDGTLMAALRVLATEPADLSCTDGFVAGEHRVPVDIRRRLLDVLDLFGIAHCVVAVRQGRSAAEVRAVLRRVSRTDSVAGRVSDLGAQARYRRILAAVAELETLAVTDGRIAGFLVRDDTVIARMAAAVEVVEAAGLAVDPSDESSEEPDAHLRRAVRWRRYGAGPLTALHRACGADIARGSLRLWSRAGGTP